MQSWSNLWMHTSGCNPVDAILSMNPNGCNPVDATLWMNLSECFIPVLRKKIHLPYMLGSLRDQGPRSWVRRLLALFRTKKVKKSYLAKPPPLQQLSFTQMSDLCFLWSSCSLLNYFLVFLCFPDCSCSSSGIFYLSILKFYQKL